MVLLIVLTIVMTGPTSNSHIKKLNDCHLTERSMQNKRVDDDSGDGVDDSDDSGDKHLTHLSQAVDCHLTERNDPNMCVVDGKEGVDNNDNDSADNIGDGGD
eukprot:14025506-Ditylum_brightwellii.AAC.1